VLVLKRGGQTLKARKAARSIDELLSLPTARPRKTTLGKAADALETVFKGLGLDPLQPEAWDQARDKFVAIFRARQAREALIRAGRLHGHTGKPGRPIGSAEWTGTALLSLAYNLQSVVWAELKKEGPENLSKTLWCPYSGRGRCPVSLKKAVALIRERFPDEYKDFNDRALSRRLSAAVQYWKRQREFEARFRDRGEAPDETE
jgi:hypothetical protein